MVYDTFYAKNKKNEIIPVYNFFVHLLWKQEDMESEIRKPRKIRNATIEVCHSLNCTFCTQCTLNALISLMCCIVSGCCTKVMTIYKQGVCPVNVCGCIQYKGCIF